MSILALLSFIFLQITVFVSPALPFSMPMRKGQRSGSFVTIMIFGPITAIGLLSAFSRWVYPNLLLLGAAVMDSAGISYLLEVALKRRVGRHTASMEYQG